MGDRLGLSNQQIGHLENGRRRITVDVLLQLVEVLDCHPADLIEELGEVLTGDERILLSKYRLLQPQQKRSLVQSKTLGLSDVG